MYSKNKIETEIKNLITNYECTFNDIKKAVKKININNSDYSIIKELAGKLGRDHYYRLLVLANSFSQDDELYLVAPAIIQGLIPCFTICSHCEFDIAIPLMIMLGHIYQKIGDFKNAYAAFDQAVKEIKSAISLSFAGDGLSSLIKFHMIKKLKDMRGWEVTFGNDKMIVIPQLGNRIIMGTSDNISVISLADAGTIVLLRSYLATCFAEVAKLHEMLGNNAQALALFQEACNISNEIEDWFNLGATFNDLGNLSVEQGYFHKAIEYFTQALEAHSRINNEIGIANAMTNLGNAYRSLGYFESPNYLIIFKYLFESVPIHRKVNNRNSEINALIGIYDTFCLIDLFKMKDNLTDQEICDFNINDLNKLISENKNLIDDAFTLVNNLASENIQPIDITEQVHFLTNKIWLLFKREEYRSVINSINYYLDLFSRIFPTISDAENLLSFLTQYEEILKIGILASLNLFKNKDTYVLFTQIINFIERLKGRLLLKLLNIHIDEKYNNIINELNKLVAIQQKNQKIVESDPSELRIREAATRGLADITSLSDKLRDTEYYKSSYPGSDKDLLLDFTNALSIKSKRFLLLDFYKMENEIIIMLYNGGDYNIVKWEIDVNYLIDCLNSMKKSIIIKNELINKLITTLPTDVINKINESDYIFIIPYMELHNIPWELIFKNKLFIRNYCLDLLTFALKNNSNYIQPNSTSIGLILFSNPNNNPLITEHVQRVMLLMRELGFNTEVLDDNNLSRESVTKNIKKASIAHFICHTKLNSSNPIESTIIIGNETFTINDIVNSETKNLKFLFINSCSAGLTNNINTSRITTSVDEQIGAIIMEEKESEILDEQIGICSCFTTLGIPSIIAPMNIVTDADSLEVSSIFYNELLKGNNIGVSIHIAQNTIYTKYIGLTNYVLFGNPFIYIKQ